MIDVSIILNSLCCSTTASARLLKRMEFPIRGGTIEMETRNTFGQVLVMTESIFSSAASINIVLTIRFVVTAILV